MKKQPIKTIVVEDERLPRLSLLQKLEDFRQQIEVVDSCDSYSSALNSILHHRPRLLFLDIQLQGRNAMSLIEELKSAIPMPYIIFTTAYDEREYLIKAIKLQAVDYLLKPIDRGELALAIEKVTRLVSNENRRRVSQINTTGKSLFRTASGHVYVSLEDIIYIYADGNYSVIVTQHDKVMVLESLLSLERMLGGTTFMRPDRKNLINRRYVYKINTKNCTCVFHTDEGSEIEIHLSKKGTEILLNAMESIIP